MYKPAELCSVYWIFHKFLYDIHSGMVISNAQLNIFYAQQYQRKKHAQKKILALLYTREEKLMFFLLIHFSLLGSFLCVIQFVILWSCLHFWSMCSLYCLHKAKEILRFPWFKKHIFTLCSFEAKQQKCLPCGAILHRKVVFYDFP